MANTTKGIKFTIIHPQWGAPMDFHTLSRIEHDVLNKVSYVVLNNYYSQEVYENGGQAMSNTAVQLNEAETSGEIMLQAVIDDPNSKFNGGVIVGTETE